MTLGKASGMLYIFLHLEPDNGQGPKKILP